MDAACALRRRYFKEEVTFRIVGHRINMICYNK
jgi:hypothetical protein